MAARSPHLWAQIVFNARSSELFAQFMVMVRDEGGAGPAIEFHLLLEISGGLGVLLLDVKTTMRVTMLKAAVCYNTVESKRILMWGRPWKC